MDRDGDPEVGAHLISASVPLSGTQLSSRQRRHHLAAFSTPSLDAILDSLDDLSLRCESPQCSAWTPVVLRDKITYAHTVPQGHFPGGD